MSRVRNYVFTINNYDEQSIEQLKSLDYKYLCYGQEVAPSTGTPHLQGFVCLTNGCTVTALRKRLKGAHVEVMKGNIDQNEKYCSKSGEYVELGTKPVTNEGKGAGEKRRWDEAFAAAQAGNWDLVPTDLKLRYTGNLLRIRHGCFKKITLRDTEEKMLWLVGPPRTGKSRYAREIAPDAYIKMPNRWWDGYQDEEQVIMDDLSYAHREALDALKVWADRYPFRGEFKGGSQMMRPKRIIVTSNYGPAELYNHIDSLAICSRFKIVQFPLVPSTQQPVQEQQ